MDIKEIKLIVDLMKRSELTEFEIEEENFKLRISRGTNQPVIVSSAPAAPAPTGHQPVAAQELAAPAAVEEDKSIAFIKSPMVGTFYRAPGPDSPEFVEKNSAVSEDSVVCIIEAMKVMNEIQAEIKGTIVEVLVENGSAVEFGQPLFKVKV